MLNFFLETVENEKIQIDELLSFELVKSIDAACDGLRLSFSSKRKIAEVIKTYVYDDDTLIFNGYVDTQREQTDSRGFSVFIYARSTACLLVDNEANPITYNNPTAELLCYKNARELGFQYDLPKIGCNNYYEVSKGTSCYGAINDFVKSLTGKNIYVDNQNTIRLLEKNAQLKIASDSVISERKIINRGNAITTIDYKFNGDNAYNHHLTSQFLKDRGIKRTQKVNILSLPSWQKQMIVKNKLLNSCIDYYCGEFELSGFHNVNLCDGIDYDSFRLGNFDDYYVAQITFKSSIKGTITKIVAYKKIEMGEINYVAE